MKNADPQNGRDLENCFRKVGSTGLFSGDAPTVYDSYVRLLAKEREWGNGMGKWKKRSDCVKGQRFPTCYSFFFLFFLSEILGPKFISGEIYQSIRVCRACEVGEENRVESGGKTTTATTDKVGRYRRTQCRHNTKYP